VQLMSVSTNTTIFNTACVFVFILSVIFLKEQISWFKIASLVCCIAGIVILQMYSHDDPGSNPTLGGAHFFNVYFVFFSSDWAVFGSMILFISVPRIA
jgi:drug/metabolite transporter (DMT)-like permease